MNILVQKTLHILFQKTTILTLNIYFLGSFLVW